MKKNCNVNEKKMRKKHVNKKKKIVKKVKVEQEYRMSEIILILDILINQKHVLLC